jgi:hypothetical protein
MFISTNIKAQQLPPNNPNYQLVFHDEFDSLGLNHNKWRNCFTWGNVEYGNIWYNSDYNDTMYTQCIFPESDSLFGFDTSGTGFIRLPLKYYPNGFLAGVWNYYKIDTIAIADTILRDWSYYGPHPNTTITHTYVDSTSANVCFSNIPVHYPYDVYQIDSIFKNNLLRVVRTCYRREFNHKTKTFYYQTPMLISNESFKYGYFEIRTHMPHLDQNHNNQGVGPTFWLWNNNEIVTWSEIDIYEIGDWPPEYKQDGGGYSNIVTHPLIGHYKHNLTSTVHYQDSSMAEQLMNHHEYGHLYFDDTSYKKISVFWEPDFIRFYLNDTILNDTIFLSSNNTNDTIYPSNLIDMYIFVYNACPVSWPKYNGHHFPLLPDLDSTLLPYNYDIDYIRVYQLKLHCDSDYYTSVFNSDTFGYGLYRTITIGNGPSVISSGKDVHLMATDAITINSNFTVGLGASLLLETKPCPQQEHNYNQNKFLMKKVLPQNFYLHFLRE